jgi:hypothetical protein
MTEHDTPSTFVCGNDIIDRLAVDPFIADDVAAADAGVEEMDRVYAMNLAMIRKAAQMTRVDGSVSRCRNRSRSI